MSIDDLLAQLEGVRRTSRGYQSRCPGHDDKRPSLSVKEGDKGLLLKCWSGCSLEQIVAALGLTARDLFYDSDRPADEWRSDYRRRVQARQQREVVAYVDGLRADACREAERLIQSAHGLDVSGRSDEQLQEALDALADAYEVLEKESAHV